jgi:hypothetical protein
MYQVLKCLIIEQVPWLQGRGGEGVIALSSISENDLQLFKSVSDGSKQIQ